MLNTATPGSTAGFQPGIDLGIEERRVAIEAIATLTYYKYSLVEFILKPAGVPDDIILALNIRDSATGRPLSKRQVAPIILDELDNRAKCVGVIRAIVTIASEWSKFHLAEHEFQARATVQKARELMGTIEQMEARERRQRDLATQEAAARIERALRACANTPISCCSCLMI